MSECACVSESVYTGCVCVCVFEPSGAESRRGIDRSRATGLSVRVSNTCVCVYVSVSMSITTCVCLAGVSVCVCLHGADEHGLTDVKWEGHKTHTLWD